MALSRHRIRCRYFDPAADRDVDGVHHGRRDNVAVRDRLVAVMSRDSRKASTLDYPAEYQRQLWVALTERDAVSCALAAPRAEQPGASIASEHRRAGGHRDRADRAWLDHMRERALARSRKQQRDRERRRRQQRDRGPSRSM